MNAPLLAIMTPGEGIFFTEGYLIGIIIATAMLGYLFYSLIKPEKF